MGKILQETPEKVGGLCCTPLGSDGMFITVGHVVVSVLSVDSAHC